MRCNLTKCTALVCCSWALGADQCRTKISGRGCANAAISRKRTSSLNFAPQPASTSALSGRQCTGASMARRADWFERCEGPSIVLWWVPVGRRPSVEEALARMEHIKQHWPERSRVGLANGIRTAVEDSALCAHSTGGLRPNCAIFVRHARACRGNPRLGWPQRRGWPTLAPCALT
jgi:hypothetical protein